jgi:hypothetical protein
MEPKDSWLSYKILTLSQSIPAPAIFGEQQKLWKTSIWNFVCIAVTSYLWVANILYIPSFSYIFNLYSFFVIIDQIWGFVYLNIYDSR